MLDGSSALATVDVNQELTPGTFNEDGVDWLDLGQFTITGSTLNVQLSDDANEFVMADAIRIEQVGSSSLTSPSDSFGAKSASIDPRRIGPRLGVWAQEFHATPARSIHFATIARHAWDSILAALGDDNDSNDSDIRVI